MEYKHFSHNHTLTPYKVQPGQQFHCRGCSLPCHGSIFACWNCSFFLHEHCGNAGRHINHPSHPPHPLILMPNPTYCSGSFLCNACGAPGNAFSYCCTLCEVDLHLHCSSLPPHLSHSSHHHALHLSFGTLDRPDHTDHCKICAKEMNTTKHWSYSCSSSECSFFRVHTACATASEVRPWRDHGDEVETLAGDQNMSAGGAHVRTELTPEEEVMLEISRMNMELQMAQSLAAFIART